MYQQQHQQAMSTASTSASARRPQEEEDRKIVALNNLGVELIQRNHHDKAITVLRRAMAMLQDKARTSASGTTSSVSTENVFMATAAGVSTMSDDDDDDDNDHAPYQLCQNTPFRFYK